MRSVPRLLATMTLTAALVGCQPQPARVYTPEMLDNFTPYSTTVVRVIQILGEPSASIKKGDGTRQLVYTSVTRDMPWYHYLPGAQAFVTSSTHACTLTLDFTDDVLVSSTVSEGNTPLR